MQLFTFFLPIFIVFHFSLLSAKNLENNDITDEEISQQEPSKIDSLLALLKNAQEPPAKFKHLGGISWEYIINYQLDKAKEYADSIRILAEELNDKERIAYSHFYYGVIARHQGNFPQSLNHLHQFVSYYEMTGDSSRVASGYFQIGAVNSALGNYEKSLEAYYRILNIYENDSNFYSIGFTLNGIGVIQRHMKKYEDAINTYQRALSIYDKLDAQEDKANILGNLANVYTDVEQFEEAKKCFSQALQIDETLGNKKWIAYDLENIGHMYNQMKKYDSALVYQLKSLAVRETLPNKIEHAMTLLQLGETYFYLKNYTKAKLHLLESFDLAEEPKPKPLLRDLYFFLAKIHSEEKDFSKAYEYHQLYASMKDSVLNEETSRQLNELQTRYETEKKDQQINLLAAEKEVQEKETARQATLKNSFIGGFIGVITLAALFIYVLRQRLKNQKLLAAKNEEIKEVDFKRKMSELELKALRAQINPHFLFNCMNSINRMILNGEADNASRYLTKFPSSSG
jgi:tetratricopeptide (TPR) repeat protein